MTDNRQRGGGNSFNRDDNPGAAMLARVDTDRLGAMPALEGGGGQLRTNFLPTSFADAMELAKLMSAGTFVPDRLRGKPGDCLAVVMQATRWGMDPFAVAQKIYFVNNNGIPGYEAQLVAAVLNSSGVLDGRLGVTWSGEGEGLKAIATGKLKGEGQASSIEVELRTITTRNSPLWKQQPKIQLGYYAQRAWGRLFAPEVMLGVYAADDLVEDGENARRLEASRAPTRQSVKAQVLDHNPDTGEVIEPTQVEDEEAARAADAEAARLRGEGDVEDALQEELDDDDGVVETTDPVVEPESETAKPLAPPPPPPPPADKSVDWDAWINKFARDLEGSADSGAVDALWQSKTERLANAPTGTKNRAKALYEARLRKLAPVDTAATAEPEKTTTTRKRSAAAASRIPDETQPEPEKTVAAEPAEPGPDDRVSDDEAAADEIIQAFNTASTIIDLRRVKSESDERIDTMDEDNAGRVTRSYRAVEDKLLGKGRK